MDLEKLQEMADKDLVINETELDLESLKTPQLHNKYMKHYWALVHAHGSTELDDAKIERDLFDREKWPKIRAVDDRGKQLGVESPLAELKTLKFVLADGFETWSRGMQCCRAP